MVLCAVDDLEDLDCPVRGTGSQLLSIVIHLGIMLRDGGGGGGGTLNNAVAASEPAGSAI